MELEIQEINLTDLKQQHKQVQTNIINITKNEIWNFFVPSFAIQAILFVTNH